MKDNYRDDDKRTVADMSGLETRGLFSQWFGIFDPNVRAAHGPKKTRVSSVDNTSEDGAYGRPRPWEPGGEVELTGEERRALIKYTLKYSLAIGGVFILAFGLLIFLMTKLWH